MRRTTIFLLALLASVAWSDEGIDVTEPHKVAALSDLQEKIDSISTAVTECISSGKVHGDCLCENEEFILTFNRTVEEFFETYSDLKTADIVRFRMSDGMVVSQSLSGIKNQAQMKLDCT